MKKLLLILILAAYTVSVSGASVEFHFCMGKYAGSSFFKLSHSNEVGCGICGMKVQKSSCCHDKTAYLKLKTDHQVVENYVSDLHQFEAILPNNFESIASTFQLIPSTLLHRSNAPPNKGSTSLNILYSVFLI
ncbi:MAG: hypothetical protein RL596_1814 [Bacteroidota bacterium]